MERADRPDLRRRKAWLSGLTTVVALVVVAPVVAEEPAPAPEVDLTGHWEGEIDLPGAPLVVKLDFQPAAPSGWSGTIDIPAQSAFGLPLREITVDGDRARFAIDGVPGAPTFDGRLVDGELTGTFTQGAARLSFRLGRETLETTGRPQDPKPPFPYREEEAVYANGDVTLAGTLTIPPGEGPFAAVVLVSGSGAQNRDEELFDHRPFRVLADALARRGIAVLRSDDRGVGGSSGSVELSTTSDFAADVLSAIEWLRARPEVAPNRIGILGHSEGGLVGPLAASRSDTVAFVVMLAGPGVSGREILPLQTRLQAAAAGADPATLDRQVELLEEIVDTALSGAEEGAVRERLMALALEQFELGGEAAREALGDDPRAAIEPQLDRLLTPWFQYFLEHDPRPVLREVEVPVLALNGELDLQVDADQNLPVIEEQLAAAGNADVTVRKLPGLNHLFQRAERGTVDEYGRIEETMSPEVLKLVGDWIVERFVTPRE